MRGLGLAPGWRRGDRGIPTIEKLVSIKYLARCRNSNATGSREPARRTLIPGDTGYGKTTLCTAHPNLTIGHEQGYPRSLEQRRHGGSALHPAPIPAPFVVTDSGAC